MAGKFVLWTLLTVFTHAKLTAILSEWKGKMKTETTGRNKKTPIVAIQRIDVTGQYL
jgi:hypothetical protein